MRTASPAPSRTPPPVLTLTGPTASGKTAAALALARALAPRLPVEIISMDSALVYRGMDIGTAKPSADELAAVPHHLIDIRDPDQPYSAAEFAHDAARLIAEIQARGALPLLVGGTLLYLRALSDGMAQLPPADPARASSWTRRRAPSAGRRCTRSWPASTRPRPRAWHPTTASASSARWRSGG